MSDNSKSFLILYRQSIKYPLHIKSSIENCPLVPELIIIRSSCNLSIALAVALEFINAEINIVFALKLLLIALVPLVVLSTTVFPSTYFLCILKEN